MSISRWMDKKAVVHIHNGVLLSHQKEHIWISSNEVDETGAYYTEWSKLVSWDEPWCTSLLLTFCCPLKNNFTLNLVFRYFNCFIFICRWCSIWFFFQYVFSFIQQIFTEYLLFSKHYWHWEFRSKLNRWKFLLSWNLYSSGGDSKIIRKVFRISVVRKTKDKN